MIKTDYDISMQNPFNTSGSEIYCGFIIMCTLLVRQKCAIKLISAVVPMPTWLVKECQHVLINPVTKIVNKSLSLSVFQRFVKAAFVKSLF